VPFRPELLIRRLVPLCLALLAGGVAASAQSSSGTSSVDLAGFVSEMDRLTTALAGAESRDVSGILTAMPHNYRIRDGEQQFDVPFEDFAQRLATARTRPANWIAQRQELVADLRLVRSEAAALQASRTPRGDPHPTLAKILSRREFAGRRDADWSRELRRRITEWFESLWRRLGGDRVNSRTTAFVLAALAIVVGTTALTVWLIRRSSPTQAPRPGLEAGPTLSSHAWALRAIASARSGDAREAARSGYRAALRRLEEQGIWQIDESRTAREYMRLLKPDNPTRDPFTALVQRFELAWFASRPLTRADLDAVGESLERLGCLATHERAI